MITSKRNISEDFYDHGADISYTDMFALLCNNIDIKIEDGTFVYFIDNKYVMDTTRGYRCENLTPDYEKILKKGLKSLKYPDSDDTKFAIDCNLVIDNISVLADRIVDEIRKKDKDDIRANSFIDIKDKAAASFLDAIQRMLFINQIFWQTDHRLIGLGAWDTFLYPYYAKDVKDGKLTEESALSILKELFLILHNNYQFKSNVLMGDTGQIFVLGRSGEEGNYICNKLTYLFIKAGKETQLTEPKCLLRVNKNVPKDLIETALDSIATGIGAPLFANDDIVIPCLTEYGIPMEDALCYTTSACWEPLIGGKSSSMNNMSIINFMRPFNNMIMREKIENFSDENQLFDAYTAYLKRNIRAVKRAVGRHRIQYNPLLSIFTEGCMEKHKDISWGGAKYHDIGVTSVGMGNVVNAFFAIRDLVFKEKKYSMLDVRKAVVLNYEGYDDLHKELRGRTSLYGTDDEDVTKFVNQITEIVKDELKDFRSYMGSKIKFGLSGAGYLDAAKGFSASFDGREADEPFIVHISNEDNAAFTEVINFASEIDYGDGRFNGNVVDMMTSPDFVNNNRDKFIEFLMASIRRGFFEMQMNVVSSKTLIAAKEHPEDFPNLIVRVWGFSAYFKDLPEDYKQVLINRALKSEGAA